MESMGELIVEELRRIRRELRGIREGMAEGWRSERERRGEEEEERRDDKRTEEEKKSGGKEDQAGSEKRGNERKEKEEEEAKVKEEGMWTEEEESVEEEGNGRSEEENRSVEEGGKRETKKEERGVGKKNGKEEEEETEEKGKKWRRRRLLEEEERRKRVRREKEEEQERREKRKRKGDVIEEERREKRQAGEGEKVCGREVGREEFGGGNGYGGRLKEEKKKEGYGEEEEGRKTEKGNVSTGTVQNQQLVPRERQNIWQGIVEFVEWIEKAKNPTDAQKQTRHFLCQVSTNAKDGDPELKADTWPLKLIMQLVPKQLIGSIGGSYLRNSKFAVFHPMPCEALESLTKILTAGFVGCIHFTSAASSPACEIKELILFYTIDKKMYLGLIPNDQTAFSDRLLEVVQQQITSQASMRQGQANPGPGNTIPAPMPTTGTQGGILMSQTNTMAMGGGQIKQNVVSTNAPPQTLTSTNGPQTQMNMQNSGISGPQANAGAGGMIGQQRSQFDDIEMARYQNLLKIQHLRQTLEAAQQQEAQYKSQLEVSKSFKIDLNKAI